jgi:hypothetical protein
MLPHPSSPSADEERFYRFTVLMLKAMSICARILTFFLILSTLFARSAWICKIDDPSSCTSLWGPSSNQIASQVFAVSSCVTALVGVGLKSSCYWVWETCVTFITLVFSLIAWPIAAQTLPSDSYLEWAFSVSVAASVAAGLAFGLSFRRRTSGHSHQPIALMMDKRLYVLCSTLSFAFAFGAMPTLLNVVSMPLQDQAGSYTAVAFFSVQAVASAFCLNFALPNGLSWSRTAFLLLQTLALCWHAQVLAYWRISTFYQ